jgi:hypothetical protein
MRIATTLAALALGLAASAAWAQDDTTMSFFVTSQNPGQGGDLGGLEGADAHCASLAEAAGVTGKTWRAYLSTSTEDARGRIGDGPWFNAEGEMIAENVEALHGEGNNVTKETALDETGAVVSGRGDEVNRHDILTGSTAEGASSGATCEDWTSNAADTAGTVGHHDRAGPEDLPTGTSWNAAHDSRGGCGMEALQGTGGDGLLYCFAVD